MAERSRTDISETPCWRISMTTTTDTSPIIAPIGHNQPPEPTPFEAITQEIQDLFDEANNFADGDPIDTPELADAITELHDKIHAAGKRADALRVDEKKPLDDAVKAIQDRFNPYIQPKKGKVDLAKSTLADLLTPWRNKIAADKAAAAAKVAEEAAAAKRAADEAMQATKGNLAARVAAEEQLAHAAALEKSAKRETKAATVGAGLVTVWRAEIVDEELALDWCFARAKFEFMALVQKNADEAVRSGVRVIPGVRVYDEKRAR